jgi:hypothetical protein
MDVEFQQVESVCYSFEVIIECLLSSVPKSHFISLHGTISEHCLTLFDILLEVYVRASFRNSLRTRFFS